MKIPIYNCLIDDDDTLTGITAMSFVETPANETDFIALARPTAHRLSLDSKKQILSGIVLKPNQLIYREDEQGNPYYIRFSAHEIERIASKMMRDGIALYNTTHRHGRPLEGNYLVELWIVADPEKDKSAALGLGVQPRGTLCASYKIGDAGYWRDEVMTGNVKGFSIEGFFNQIKVNMNKFMKTETHKKGKRADTILRTMGIALRNEGSSTASAAKGIADEAQKDTTASGTALLAFELADGKLLEIDNDGFATIDGEQAPAGTHQLADGNFILIDENGIFQGTQPETEGESPKTPKAQLSAAIERGKAYLTRKEDTLAGRIEKLEAEITRLKSAPSAPPARANDTRLAATPSIGRNRMIAGILTGKMKK